MERTRPAGPARINQELSGTRRRIEVTKGISTGWCGFPHTITFEELKCWAKDGQWLRHCLRYHEARLSTYRLEVLPRPLLTALMIRLLSRGNAYFQDERGQRRDLTLGELVRLTRGFLSDGSTRHGLLKSIRRRVSFLRTETEVGRPNPALDLSQSPVYLRTDLSFGIRSGGSVGHVAGVLNHLAQFSGPPILLTTDPLPMLDSGIETLCLSPRPRYWDFRELPSFCLNHSFKPEVLAYLKARELSFVYQRYSLNNFMGVELSRARQVPLVLEYNGSEIWINRHWAKPLKYEALSQEIEDLNLSAAHLVVVVSQPMKQQLVNRGISARKILVNPNGVEPELYYPEIDGESIRRKYGLADRIVVGFIGTFGKWHGAEILAQAFARLVQTHPALRPQVRLLMIGDGVAMPRVRSTLAEAGVMDITTLTGTVPQEQGPGHLAACDILASPHVPNPDGSPFFGSPTKLFEYMAMGRGIVASNLDQIGEILEHGRTGCLVEPRSIDSLALGLYTLIQDQPLRQRLGKNARQEVLRKHTWKEHTNRIIERLKEHCPCA